ncbi:MAG: tRNA (N6-threonylcarbamoyladenosine(37)-N6)-methyltransferase TrmO [Clostridia bacterium]|nr:tRNA (N6-threonylcarbamoyladenosine(37)-N6)-methyltransferase TrmO [Clostridia bacterium]
MEPIAVIHTPYATKFGIPRQSGLAETPGRIVFEKEYRVPEAVRGLEAYSHLWLIWEFTEAKSEGWSPTVRPPRLGGNRRVGVFATRSPFRPNSLGLSCVKIERVALDEPDAPVIYVRGADLLDGTPIYDIKPYLPFTDAVTDAVGGFSEDVKAQRLSVDIPGPLREALGGDLPVVTELLAQDPRPHYQDDPDREYRFEYNGQRIAFRVENGTAYVLSAEKISGQKAR